MKRAVALLGFVWLSSCTFPEFVVSAEPADAPSNATCKDGERNGDETGVDCGMSACGTPCAAAQGCNDHDDCESAVCTEGECQAPTCDDETRNGTETDVDCGGDGGCAPCGEGRRCEGTSDCDGGECVQRRCQAASCRDGLRNGSETDTDCGGDCAPCDVGAGCSLDQDCDGGACARNECQPTRCDDGLRNGDETDIDCGGSCASACAVAARCQVAEDCASGVCPKQTLRCAEPSCDDGVLNGDEPSLDCGAACEDKCATFAACFTAADCAGGSCVGERCLPTQATGEKLSTAGWTATASHTFSNSSPAFAIDGSQTTDWTTGTSQAAGQWFVIDMKSERVFFSIEIDCTNTRADSATALDFAFSSDGTFDAPPALQNVPGADELVVRFSKPQVARYLRLTLAEGSSNWWRMDEIRVKQ